MSRQVLHDGRDALRVRFAYDRRLVDLVKQLPERRWRSDGKYWVVPDRHVVALVSLLASEGFDFDRETRRLYLARGGSPSALPAAAGDESPRPLLPLEGAVEDPSPPAGSGAPGDLTVSKLNAEVRRALAEAFPQPLWLVGEISGYGKSAHKRIVGFHLVERDESGKSLAEVNAVLFEEARREIEAALELAGSPFRLEDEIRVRVRGLVELYEPWGQFRFRVTELDPGYTLGEAARRREEIVRRLVEQGLLGRNTSLAFPDVPLRVGLVTSLGSDACRDVLRTLEESGFAFRVIVHGARVQGRSTEPSVLNALDWFRARIGEIDVVLICRGGGSRTDLAWFDSEALGQAAALFPIPVVVGIGHEQDVSVLDSVGWRCKTPTAAAAFLVERVRASIERTEEAARSILEAAARSVEDERRAHAERSGRIARAVRALVAAAAAEIGRRSAAVPRAAVFLVERRRVALEQGVRQLVQGSLRDVLFAGRRLADAAAGIVPRGLRHLAIETERLESRARRLHLVDPRRVVERGYAILRAVSGRVLVEAAAAPSGAAVSAELRRGRLRLRSEGPEAEEGG